MFLLGSILHVHNLYLIPSQGNTSGMTDGEWKTNLPLQGQKFLQQLEGQVEKMKKERDQKQFQMDSLEQVMCRVV